MEHPIKKKRNPDIKKPVDMLSLDRLLPMAGGSIFRLARIAMLRAVDLHYGSPPLIDHLSSDKETTIALKEIAQGKVAFKNNGE